MVEGLGYRAQGKTIRDYRSGVCIAPEIGGAFGIFPATSFYVSAGPREGTYIVGHVGTARLDSAGQPNWAWQITRAGEFNAAIPKP